MEMLTPIRSTVISAVACLSPESLEILRRADRRELTVRVQATNAADKEPVTGEGAGPDFQEYERDSQECAG